MEQSHETRVNLLWGRLQSEVTGWNSEIAARVNDLGGYLSMLALVHTAKSAQVHALVGVDVATTFQKVLYCSICTVYKSSKSKLRIAEHCNRYSCAGHCVTLRYSSLLSLLSPRVLPPLSSRGRCIRCTFGSARFVRVFALHSTSSRD